MSEGTDYPASDATSASDATTLDRLRQLWAGRYYVNLVDGRWSAWRVGNALHRMEARSGEELRAMLSDDSQRWAADARRHNR